MYNKELQKVRDLNTNYQFENEQLKTEWSKVTYKIEK